MVARILEEGNRFRKAGVCVVWGAGAKGATLLNTIDSQNTMVDYVVDINPNKQGKFIPGTGHPIHPPAHLQKFPATGILLMNPNYFSEIRDQMESLGLDIPLISL